MLGGGGPTGSHPWRGPRGGRGGSHRVGGWSVRTSSAFGGDTGRVPHTETLIRVVLQLHKELAHLLYR